jgi:pyruvate/2-oxoglutarate/acetoin dehydrogenase E1 component
MRKITYSQAISEAMVQCMTDDPNIFVFGQCVDDHKGTYGTTGDAFAAFGRSRIIDAPNAENAMAGICFGAAATGSRPVMIFTRADFMFLAMDAIVNIGAKWRYSHGDKGGAPAVMRGIVGRGWGQGSTHSQSPHALFGHFPGLYVGAPASPADAKGMLVQALRSEDPVVLIENRGLYNVEGEVPREAVPVPFGQGRVVQPGSDITIVAASLMVYEAQSALDLLAQQGVSAELIDVRSIRPLDEALICSSVAKTGRLVVVDTSWARYGLAAEVAAVVAENVPSALREPVRRLTPPDCPSPVSWPLEEAFNPNARSIAQACFDLLHSERSVTPGRSDLVAGFTGPF